jgi:hypothetical protein
LVYDASTGEIRDDRNHMSMLEDFWLPRREGGRGTEISTLPGGTNLGEIDDIVYFQRRLYRSLNVPISRLESENGFSLGRATEVTRDELKFTKFVQRIRKKFTPLFTDLLKTQLLLKGIIAPDDWANMQEHIQYDFLEDGHFAELKEAELLNDRIQTLDSIQSYIGTFFSKEYVLKNVLHLNDGEISEMQDQIKKENETDVEDGGIEVPDGGDGVTRYPQDGDGGVIEPESMMANLMMTKNLANLKSLKEKMMSREFVDALASGNNIEAEQSFNNAMSGKVGDALEIRRRELANTFVKFKDKEADVNGSD